LRMVYAWIKEVREEPAKRWAGRLE